MSSIFVVAKESYDNIPLIIVCFKPFLSLIQPKHVRKYDNEQALHAVSDYACPLPHAALPLC